MAVEKDTTTLRDDNNLQDQSPTRLSGIGAGLLVKAEDKGEEDQQKSHNELAESMFQAKKEKHLNSFEW